MKRFTAWMLVIAMALAMGAALAETEAAEPEGDIFDQAREWWQNVSAEAAEWNAGVADYFAEGTEVAKETLAGYIDAAETWFNENFPSWNEDVQQAWDTLKEAATEGTAEAKAQAQEAYETIRAWMLETGETMNEGTQAIFDAMAAAAGVEEPAEETAENGEAE